MQLKNLGNSLNAIKDIESVINKFNNIPYGLGWSKNLSKDLVDATKGYSTEVLKLAIAQTTLDETQIKAILTAKGLKGEILETTTAKLAQTTATNTLSVSEGVATGTTIGLGAAFKGLAASIKSFVVSNPALTIIAIATAAIAAGVAVYTKLHPSLEKATEDLKEQKEAFESVSQEVTTLSDKLQTAKDQLEELQSKGSLSLVENEELAKLKEATAELETQLAVKMQEQRLEAKKTADAADKAFNGIFRSKYNDNGELIIIDKAVYSNDAVKELENSIKAYYKLQEEYNTAKKNADFFIKESEKNGGRYSATGKVDYAQYEKYAKQMESLQALMDYASTQAQNMYDAINGQKEAYEGLYQAGYDLRQDQLAKYQIVREGANAYNDFCQDINDTVKAFSELSVEQKRSKLEANFVLSGQSENNAKEIVASISDDELDVVAGLSFNYTDTVESVHEAIKIAQGEADQTGGIGVPTDIIPTISSSISQLATQLEPQFAELGEAYKSIFTDDGFTLDNIDNSMLEELRSTFAEIEDEVGVAFDATKLDSFFDALTTDYANAEDGAKNVQQAFNDLATAYFYSTDTLEQLNSETADAIEKQLEEMGVVNAQTVVADALAAKTEELIVQKEYLAQTGQELSSVSDEEATAFILEQIEAGNCGEALALLQLKKLLVNSTQINTAADIEQIMNLASAAGMGAEVLTQLANAKSILSTVEAGGTVSMASYDKALSDVESAKQTMLDWKPVEIDFSNIGGGSSSAGKAGSDAGDEYVSQFENELKKLDDLKSQGKISEKQYLDALKALYQKFFGDKKKYAEQYAKYERQYLEGMKSLYDSALSGISKLMSSKIDGYTQSKEVAISSLEAEKEAAEDAYQAQIDAIQSQIDAIDDLIDEKNKQIDAINEEIDKIKEASEARKRDLELQKAQYELERMQNQRTQFIYDGEQMIYRPDESGIRDARENITAIQEDMQIAELEKQISLIEKEIDLLEDQKDGLEKQQDAIQKMIDESNKYYESLIKQQETYWDSMIKNMEQQKSKWEELADIQEIAEAYSAIEQVFGDLGYSVEDVLNGSAGAFEDFKSRYISIMSDMNQNTSFQEGLEYASGVAKESFGSIVNDAQESMQQLSQTFSDGTFSDAISKGVSDGIVAAQQELDKMNQLGTDAGDGFIEGWKEKSTDVTDATKQTAMDAVDAFAEGQDSHSPSEKYRSLAGDAIDGLLLGVEEKRQLFIDVIKSLAEEGVLAFEEGFTFDGSTLSTSFDSLILLIESVTEALGLGTEGSIGGLLGALDQLSKFSLGGTEEGSGIVSQFNNLKNAIDAVTGAIGGAGGSTGGDASSSSSPSMSSGDTEGGAGGLVGAIDAMKQATDEALGSGGGEEGSEGEGTGAIGQFEQLKTAVDEVTTAIGAGEENGESSSEEDAANLVGAITNLGAKTEEILAGEGENGSESGGVIGRFTEFKDVIGEANEHVTGISDGLAAIDGQEVECTIKVNIETTGGLPIGLAHATGTALDSMNFDSAEYNAKYGKAHVEGTAKLTGDWGVREGGRSLCGEMGQELVVRGSHFFTVGDNGAEFVTLRRGDIVFNAMQTKELLKNGHISGRGKAFANGTLSKYPIVQAPETSMLDPMDDPTLRSIKIFEEITSQGSTLRNIETHTQEISRNVSTINNKNIQPSFTVGDIHVTCPGVTSQEVAKQVGVALEREFSGLHLAAYQRVNITR